MSNNQLGTLNRLHRLCIAGERGFNTLAAAVKSKGVKLLLKAYALQRQQFASELAAEIGRLGGQANNRATGLGIVHRGRIIIFSTMTLGQDNIQRRAINEALRGERVAEALYHRALGKDLAQSSRKVIERQSKAIAVTADELRHLRGEPGRRLVVTHFDSVDGAHEAEDALVVAAFEHENNHIVDVDSDMQTYLGKQQFMRDAIVSGAFGGGFWGLILGIGAGGFLLAIPEANPMAGMGLTQVAILSIVLGVLFGAIFGAIIGYFIGVSIKEEDLHVYDDLTTPGSALLYVKTNRRRAIEARNIMRRSKGSATLPDPAAIGDTPLVTV